MKPRDSIPANASISFHSASPSSASIAAIVASKWSRSSGEMSRNRIPGRGKSGTLAIARFKSIIGNTLEKKFRCGAVRRPCTRQFTRGAIF